MSKKRIAVVGATGAVGREMLAELEEAELNDVQIEAYASPKSEGERLQFGKETLKVAAYRAEALKGVDYVLMSAGGAFSKQEAGKILAVNEGRPIFIIDNSSAWRMEPGVPLVVPEVNAKALSGYERGIIANPNCSTIQLVLALAPLKRDFGLEKVFVATYQSVSGSGHSGIKELGEQIQASLNFKQLAPKVYRESIAFNVINQIGDLDEAGHSVEEIKMVVESQKILEMPELAVMATAARVPVFNCHSEAVSVELKREVTESELLKSLGSASSVILDKEGEYSSPLKMVGQRGAAISRVRLPYGAKSSRWVSFWVVADNLRKGAATNAVQIMQECMR